MLVELTVMEQRYQAVLEVPVQGATVTDVARRYGVHRKSVHAWIRRYREGGVGALGDRSYRPERHPRQIAADVEALVCELRRAHPSWGPRRLVHELATRNPEQTVSRSSVYRLLVRNGLVDAKVRKRRPTKCGSSLNPVGSHGATPSGLTPWSGLEGFGQGSLTLAI